MHSMRRTAVLVFAALLVLAACGGDDPDGGAASQATAPATGPANGQSAGADGEPEGLDGEPVEAPITAPTRTLEPIGTDAIAELTADMVEPLELATRADLVPESQLTGDPLVDAKAYLEATLTNADATWAQWFVGNGFPRPLVGYVVLPEEASYTSGCQWADGTSLVITGTTNNAYYCPVDEVVPGYRGTIWLPLQTFLQMWDGDIFDRPSERIGDFAAAVVVAHEFGHHVADEIAQGAQVAPPTGKNSELIADCFAGNWAASVYAQGLLEEGDVEEAVAALSVIGDVGESEYPHGTGEERVSAFTAGYAGIQDVTGPGDPASCFRLYWTG